MIATFTHHYTSTPAGRIIKSFDDERDPLQAQLFENPGKMSSG